MASILEGGCRVTTIREGSPIVTGTLKVWRQVGRDTGAHAISLRTLQFDSGQSPVLLNPQCDQVVYVVEGQGTIQIDGGTYDIEPETGIYIRPGQAFSVWNPNIIPIVFISSQCPEPESGAEVIGSAHRGPSPSLSASARKDQEAASHGSELPGRDPDMSVANSTEPRAGRAAPLIRLADRKTLPTGDRWYRILVDDDLGSTLVTQFIGSIPPGRAPDHFHVYEEVLFILRGEGRMWAGKSSTPIATGSCIYLPTRQNHCVENTGTGELRLLGVFYPAGSPAVRYDAD
jgi:mannose-6-phosphate isomerase-like protein (cupin superfamily)